MIHAHFICFCALSVYYIKNIYGQYIGGLPYPHLNDQCQRLPLMLNDCNWCKCDTLQYQCQVRNCHGNSDPFGAINDAIKEVAVGMEGHGFWRSYSTQCAAHIQYQRENLLCVCNGRGEWPSAACRDAFRVLYPIEQFVQELQPGDACLVNKLYIIGCNVCICPTNGQINKQYCTTRECTTLDETINVKDRNFNPRNYTVDEIYTTCDKGVKLLVEGKECECHSGNRIICNDDEDEQLTDNELSIEIGASKQIELLDKDKDKAIEKENNKDKVTDNNKDKENDQDSTNEKDKEKISDNNQNNNENNTTDKDNTKEKEEKKEKDIVATIVFVKPPYTGVCPPNEFVKVGCNYCFCMKDGNGICTTFKC